MTSIGQQQQYTQQPSMQQYPQQYPQQQYTPQQQQPMQMQQPRPVSARSPYDKVAEAFAAPRVPRKDELLAGMQLPHAAQVCVYVCVRVS